MNYQFRINSNKSNVLVPLKVTFDDGVPDTLFYYKIGTGSITVDETDPDNPVIVNSISKEDMEELLEFLHYLADIAANGALMVGYDISYEDSNGFIRQVYCENVLSIIITSLDDMVEQWAYGSQVLGIFDITVEDGISYLTKSAR